MQFFSTCFFFVLFIYIWVGSIVFFTSSYIFMNKLITEFLWVFFLVLVIALSGDPLTIGVVLMVMVYMWGHVSWAHYNPAATLAIWMRWWMWMNEALQYALAQVLGWFFAVVVASIFGATFIPAFGPGVEIVPAFVAEFLFTFALVLVILNVATAATTKWNDYFGAAIGLIVFVWAMSVWAISGWVFNPAVGLGPWLFDVLQWGGFAHIRVYIVATLLWWAAAAWVFGLMNPSAK